MADFWPVVFSLAQLTTAYALLQLSRRLDRLLAQKLPPATAKPSVWSRVKARFFKKSTPQTQEAAHG